MTNSETDVSPDDGAIGVQINLQSYFHDEMQRHCSEQSLQVGHDTIWYLTKLLETYSRSDKFFDFHTDSGTLTPLADYYAHAIQAETLYERRQLLQRLGDVSMFVSGLFSNALNRRPVNLDYYMAMGENAYGFLADTANETARDRALASIFSELANQFSQLVELLGCLRRPATIASSMQPSMQTSRQPATETHSALGIVLTTTPTLVH